MEMILSSGLFWGALAIAFVAIVGYVNYRYEKADKKQTPAQG